MKEALELQVGQVSDLPTRVKDPRYSTLVFAAVIALLPGCSNNTAVEQGIRDQVVHMGNGVEPGDLDPHTNTGSPESVILAEIFEGLVSRSNELEVVPGAAERWEFSAEGRIITFHLRPGLKWSNGDPLNARDFLASFKRLLTPSLGAQFASMAYPVAGAEDYHTGKTFDFTTVGFQAIDDLTFRIILDEPTPSFMQLLTGYPFLPVHMPSVERFGGAERPGTAWTRAGNLVSNGEMMLKSWEPNKVLVVERNPHYRDRTHDKLNEIRFYPIESQDTEERAFRTGQLHITYTMPVSKIDTYRKENSPALHITPRLGAGFLIFNTEKAPFDDARVRRAFSLAINREQIATAIYRAGQTPAYSLSQDGMGGYHPTRRITGGADEARALLAEAGFPGGAGFPKIEYLYNTSELNRDVAQAIQQMWRRELGIDVSLVNEEWKVFLNTRDLGNFQIARAGWNPFADDPNEYFQQIVSTSPFNDSNWSDPEFDALYNRAIHTLDEDERFMLFDRMDEIVLREMPVVPIIHSAVSRLVHPSVQNWVDNRLDSHVLSDLWLSPGDTP